MTFWQSRFNPQIKLSQHDLLKYSEKISREFTPQAWSVVTKLVLLPVDPFHLYAYWNLVSDSHHGLNDSEDLKLKLRIYWRNTDNSNSGYCDTVQWFDVSVSQSQHQQKVKVPEDGAYYSAVIGRHYVDQSFLALAYSNIIHTPRSTIAKSVVDGQTINQVEVPLKQSVVNKQNRQIEQVTEQKVTDKIEFTMKDNLFSEGKKALKSAKPKLRLRADCHPNRHASGSGINQ